MYNAKYIIPGVLIAVVAFTSPFWLNLGGKTYGQILLELPGEDRLAQRVTAWLDANFPSYSLEV